MFPTSSLFGLVLAAVSLVSAQPTTLDTNKFTLAFAAKVNTSGIVNLPQADRARIAFLRTNVQARDSVKRGGVGFSVQNTAVTYTASVGVGSPATQYTLLIDTGSSNTWVGADKKYKPTRSAKKTGQTVSVSYGSGSFTGDEYTDTVTFAKNLVIEKQSIGVATKSEGIQGVDGILGIGPADLTIGTISDGTAKIPTVVDNLASTGKISSGVLGIFYVPESSSDTTGELTFGGVDTSKTTGPVHYVPISSATTARRYWGIDQSVSYGGQTILASSSGIVDTGTTLTMLSSDAFKKYQKATGAVIDSKTGLLKLSKDNFKKLKNLDFSIGGQIFSLTPNAQIWPRSLNSDISGDADSIYLIIADVGAASGTGLDFVNGYTFLERFYSVYDTKNSRVGFATTKFTTATTN